MKQSYSAIPLLLLTVAVQNANATATVVNDSATMVQNSGSIIINVLANDSSTNLSEVIITSNSTTSVAYGSVVRNQDNTLTYTPSEGFVGTDTFTYNAADNTGYGGMATVTVEVTAAPIVVVPNPSLLPYVTGGRNKAVASMLDQVCFDANISNELGRSCGLLYAQVTDANADAIMAQIAPDEALTQGQLLTENARTKTSRLYSSLAQLRSGSGGASVSVNNITLPSGGAAGSDLGSPWTLLSALQIEDLERSSSLNEAGYDSKALGLMLGFGYRVGSHFNMGAALDWTNYDVDYVKTSGTLDSDTYGLTGFVSWYDGPLSVDLQAGYTAGQSDAQRRFTFPVIAFANSSYDSNQLTFSTQVEWSWQPGAWAVRPFLRVDYLDSEIDGFSETGTSVWLMQASRQNQQKTNASIGLNTSYTANFAWGVMVPSIKLSLVNQDNLNNDPVAFQLLNANSALGQFQLSSDATDKQFYEWELSSVMVMANGLSTFISAKTVSGYDNISSHQISGGINWEF